MTALVRGRVRCPPASDRESFCGSRKTAFRSAPTQTGVTRVVIRAGGTRAPGWPVSISANLARPQLVFFVFAGNRCGDCSFNGLKSRDALAQSSAAGYIHLSLN